MGSIVDIQVLANDYGPNPSAIKIHRVGAPSSGRAEIVGSVIRFIPELTFTGTVLMQYSITDEVNVTEGTITVFVLDNWMSPEPELYFDVNANGTRESTEPGIGGVPGEVELVGRAWFVGNGTGSIIQTNGSIPLTSLSTGDSTTDRVSSMAAPVLWTGSCTTSSTGVCAVPGAPAGQYQVRIDYATAIRQLNITADPDGTLDLSALLTPNNGVLPALQFGLAGGSTLRGRVFDDNYRDFRYTAPIDDLLPNRPVRATWSGIDGILDTPDDMALILTTNARGEFAVTNAPIGTWRIAAGFSPRNGSVPAPERLTLSIGTASRVDIPVVLGRGASGGSPGRGTAPSRGSTPRATVPGSAAPGRTTPPATQQPGRGTPSKPKPSPIPSLGSNSVPLVIPGIGLIVAGFLLLGDRRRRPQRRKP
jgi:hypothetical protein